MGKVMQLDVKLGSSAERTTRTHLDTIEITPALARSWKAPPVQRGLRINAKVLELVAQVRKEGVLPGVLTIGIFQGVQWLVDGQYRVQAFLLADIPQVYADVRFHYFDSMGEMGAEWVRLNDSLVRKRPDDTFRALEYCSEAVRLIRRQCPFVGYDMIRRNDRAPILSMAMVVRSWQISVPETPVSSALPAAQIAQTMPVEDAKQLCVFLNGLYEAWGRDVEYVRLWGGLSLTLTMWLYRRLVLMPPSGIKRSVRLTPEEFSKAAMALSASASYLDWLTGRTLNERDRSPCMGRMKQILGRRLTEMGMTNVKLPQPPWAHHVHLREPRRA